MNTGMHDWSKMSVWLGSDCEYRCYLCEQQKEGVNHVERMRKTKKQLARGHEE